MFVLDSTSSDPLYVQLYRQIKEHVLSGRLPAHSRLASVRTLAKELSVSRTTVEGCYQELHAEGYIYARTRSGYFVSAVPHDLAPLPQPPESGDLCPLPRIAPACEYDFHPARLARDSFPVALWRRLYVERLRESSSWLGRYSDPQGEWELRKNIQRYLERSRGVVCTPEQVVICSGLQESLGIVARLVRDSHPRVAVENPGYPLPRSVFRDNSLEVVPIPVGLGGIHLDRLRKSGCNMAYVTPSHQFPLGYVMPIGNRMELIEWAETGGNIIVEDDYDSELRYHGRPIPSLQGLHPHGNIIYTGTFSKILSPALRVSYMVLPRPLVGSYRCHSRHYLASVPLLDQRTLGAFMEQGYWERHVRRMRTMYMKKHDSLLAAIARHFGRRATVVGQGAGLHVVLQLPAGAIGEKELIARALEKGICLFPFSETRAGDEGGPPVLLLGCGAMASDKMEEGIKLLSRICCGGAGRS